MSVRRGFRRYAPSEPSAPPTNRLTPENVLAAKPAGPIALNPTMVLPPVYLQLGPVVAAFQLTLPPPLSRLTRNAAGPGRAATREAKAWREGNAMLVGSHTPFEFKVEVWIYLGLNSLRPDVANFEKATTDLLVHCGVLRDDSAAWVKANHQVHHDGVEKGMALVEIRRAV